MGGRMAVESAIMASFFIVERSVVIVDDRGCRELFLTVVGQKKTYFFGR
jgi:hypothetical protein